MPPKGRHWSGTIDKWNEKVEAGLAYFGKDGDGVPAYKKYLRDAGFIVPITWWPHRNSGHTDEASKELSRFDIDVPFETPKPVRLLSKILAVATHEKSIVLDSFSGSGTTAHAVLEANHHDGGSRRFILVEMENYADKLTAERIRHLIHGYKFSGTHRTELMREKITWSRLKNSHKLMKTVESIENLHGHAYDRIRKQVKAGELIVTGETMIEQRTEGLGGFFTFCTLGAPVELDKLLTGEALPPWEGLGAALFHMATNRASDSAVFRQKEYYVGEADGQHVWLIYQPDLDWLKSPAAALTLTRAKNFAATDPERQHLVFAPSRFVSQKTLTELNLRVEFAPLPYALYRIDRG